MGVLRDDALVVLREGHVLVDGPLGYDDAGRVHARVAGHALELPRGVYELADARVALVHLAQGLGQLERLGEGHANREGHLLGDGVAFGVAHVQRAARVAHGLARGHGAEGDYLRDVVAAVLAVHVLYDLAAAAHAEVYVYIRHAHALGVQEALEVEAVFYGVDVGYIEAVAHDAARRAAAAGAYGDALALRVADEVGDYEEVVDKSHALYHVELVHELAVRVLPARAVALFKAGLAELLQVLEAVRLPLWELEAGADDSARTRSRNCTFRRFPPCCPRRRAAPGRARASPPRS